MPPITLGEIRLPVSIKIGLIRPVTLFFRLEDGAIHQCQHVSRHVAVDTHSIGNQHFVCFAHAHQPFVEGPVAQPAQAQTVGGQVVMTFAPGNDVGGLHHGVPFRRAHADSAQGAAVIVEVENRPAEALVTNSLNLRRSLSKARRAFLDAAKDIHSVGECGQIYKRLFFQERLDLR